MLWRPAESATSPGLPGRALPVHIMKVKCKEPGVLGPSPGNGSPISGVSSGRNSKITCAPTQKCLLAWKQATLQVSGVILPLPSHVASTTSHYLSGLIAPICALQALGQMPCPGIFHFCLNTLEWTQWSEHISTLTLPQNPVL